MGEGRRRGGERGGEGGKKTGEEWEERREREKKRDGIPLRICSGGPKLPLGPTSEVFYYPPIAVSWGPSH